MKIFWNYIYGPFAVVMIFIWTILCSFTAFSVSFVPKRKLHDGVISLWAHVIIKLLGATVIVQNKELLKDKGCLLLFNHLSLIDIPLIYVAVGGDLRFGAKIELFRIPLFGHALRRLGFLPVERNNRSGTLKIYEKAKSRCQNGERFILAPEGTRQDTLTLGSFKSGPFILAIQAGIPLLPVLIAGPEKIYPKHSLLLRLNHKVVFKVCILEEISTEGFSLDDRNKLKDITWKKMNAALKNL
jgi:1-acyl-sn-glycerol-3-phosphate acyltransferase